MLTPRKYLLIACGVTLGVLLLLAALVVTVDPFLRYRAPGPFKLQFSAKNALQMIPGVLRHIPHDTVILGNSMMLNTNLADVRELLGWEAVKATAGGSWPAALSRFMDIAFEQNPDLPHIIIGVSLSDYARPADFVQFPLDTYLYDPAPWRDVHYFWNRDVHAGALFRAIQVTLGGGSKKYRQRTRLDTMFSSNLVADEGREYGEDIFRAWYKSNPPSPPPPAVLTLEGMMAGLETNLLRHVRNHRNTQFEIVLPPYSTLQWYLTQQKEAWPLLLDFHVEALTVLITEPNVRVHELQTVREIVCNPDNYKDSVHHKPSVNRWVIERVAAQDHVMTLADIPPFLEAITHLGHATNQPPWVK